MRTARPNPFVTALLLSVVGGVAFFFMARPAAFANEEGSVADGEFVAFSELTPWPDVVLHDTDRRPIDSQRLRGKPWWVFFGYAHCPTVCPTVLGKVALAQQKMRDRDDEPPTLLFVSLDPSDSRDDIDRFVSKFGESLLGATGSESQVRTLARALGTHFRSDPAAPGQILHSGAVFVLNERAEVIGQFTPPHDPAVLALAEQADE